MPESQEPTTATPRDKRAQLAELLRERASQAWRDTDLSEGQRALWLLQRLAPDTVAYNLMASAHIRGSLDVGALRRAFQALTDRHESLRTTFPEREGAPLCRIHSSSQVAFVEIEGSSWSEEELRGWMEAQADEPFDLGAGPLFKTILIHRGSRDPVLLVLAHHIILDFWSIDLLLEELRLLHARELGIPVEVPPIAGVFSEYVQWQRGYLGGSEFQTSLDYWEGVIGDCPQILDLPTDRPRPNVQTYRGALHEFDLEISLTARLRELARAEGVTLYTLLLSAFEIFIHRFSGQSEFLVGTPVGGRTRAEFETVVGDFANPICLRADCS
ncbi:MAG: non-ribosomal peptide synthetase, partial [Candidatus Omnitrophica bacterium]|nr:non-ribosomal peptide synthetase [Candidatus Omnitrophota bacterium]